MLPNTGKNPIPDPWTESPNSTSDLSWQIPSKLAAPSSIQILLQDELKLKSKQLAAKIESAITLLYWLEWQPESI